MKEQLVKLKAADTILRRGVRVPIVSAPLLLRVFGVRRLSVTLHQPTMGALIMIGRVVAEMGLSSQEFQNLTVEQCYRLVEQYGEKVMQILSIVILRRKKLVERYHERLAVKLLWKIEPTMQAYALRIVLLLNGVADFINSIRSIQEEMPDLLSPRIQGSQEDE